MRRNKYKNRKTILTQRDPSYTDRLKEHIGPDSDGRIDYFNLTTDQTIELIKNYLKTCFSCNVWTLEYSKEEIKKLDNELTRNSIVHCYDDIMHSLVCFNSVKEMKDFYDDIRKSLSSEDLNFMIKNNIDSPVVKWYNNETL